MTQRVSNYATVLFELNIAEDCVQTSKDMLLNAPELLEALSNPSIKKSEKHAVIDSLFEKEITSFLKVLCDHDCMDRIGEIMEGYEAVLLDSKNMIKASLTFASRPDEDQLDKIKEMVCTKYNKTDVLLELKEDASLLGGFVLTVGDTEYDKSVQGTLSNLKKALVWR